MSGFVIFLIVVVVVLIAVNFATHGFVLARLKTVESKVESGVENRVKGTLLRGAKPGKNTP